MKLQLGIQASFKLLQKRHKHLQFIISYASLVPIFWIKQPQIYPAVLAASFCPLSSLRRPSSSRGTRAAGSTRHLKQQKPPLWLLFLPPLPLPGTPRSPRGILGFNYCRALG